MVSAITGCGQLVKKLLGVPLQGEKGGGKEEGGRKEKDRRSGNRRDAMAMEDVCR